ncbi:MAG TPA: GNAT family N-acetyltransferase [Solirubrobacterales bacterium]|nr:GNAT family N-acetyltransferase [Solirubrobacterales bacterium]
MSATQITVADNADRERYEIRVDGRLAGFLRYLLRPGLIELVHTEVNDEFEGRGLGGQLIAFALDDARGRGLAVLPFCPFANDYIRRHPRYVELVPEGRRPGFGL